MSPTGNLTYLLKNHVLPKKYLKANPKANQHNENKEENIKSNHRKKLFFYKSLGKRGDTNENIHSITHHKIAINAKHIQSS